MKLPPLLSLRSFEAVARLCSVTRAAEELCVSTSAVSQQIHSLEKWLGVRLIEPSGRGIRLTAAGESYKLDVCQAFDTLHTGTQQLRNRNASVVRVSCLPIFATAWLMPQMPDFWAQHPDIQVAVRYSPIHNVPDAATVDVAIQDGDPRPYKDFVARPALEAVTFPFASPEYLQRVGYKDLGDLAKLNLLHFVDRSTWRQWLVSAAATGQDVDPALADTGVLYANSIHAFGACLAGEGVAMLPGDVVLAQVRAKILVPLSDLGVFEGGTYSILTPKSRPLPHGALVFVEWLQSLPGALKPGVLATSGRAFRNTVDL